MASSGKYLVAVAIDFGTTYSGYAFSFRHQYKRDPLDISLQNWIAQSGGLSTMKTSTCVLFDPRGCFDSFGFDAEDKYLELSLGEQHKGWYFFRRFKMKLYENKFLSRTFTLTDDQGQTMQALKVFSACINHLRDQMMTSCEKQLTGIKPSDILWVLTVPAIWSDASKQFMREAAEAAGITGDHLRIALEPEAASLYCKHLPLEVKGGDVKTFTSEAKYLVLDAGGGTIDITVHEVQRDGSLKEIHKANGGDWGGTKVDQAYQLMISGVIGDAAFHRFMENNKADMVEFFREFELKKRTIKASISHDDLITFNIPVSMNDACAYQNGKDIEGMVISKRQQDIQVKRNKLRVSGNRAKELFKDPTYHIVDHLKKMLRDPTVREIRSILMVGGFSESLVLQDEIRRNFPNLQVIVPQDAGLAILKGAVIYGHEPNTITTRVCKYTYGVNHMETFEADWHDPSQRFTTSYGKVFCDNLFSIHVRIGDSVDVGQSQTKQSYCPIEPDQTSMAFKVYATSEINPVYVTDPGCTNIGQLEIAIPDTSKGLDRSVTVQMTFSNTELEVEATDTDTDRKVFAAYNFL